ncbi:MAG: DUF423 domain-containing protein [Algoriphagus aquaeductus]|uniref:Uncharacterized membrane protein YgdD (TMEM256/DUF423 family) n=1 Tax=Algoriphagus aquaeductus TaxID=475299 RepID=A0A326RT75_9BACT|nr:DUF423 domain-containing protein [Algoriphagus aquaeductus]PZV83907.1 uncharacterized membrane protein YgdD (TMEM256/DUF423 family) [Algoriphagus aquaeductus]
MKGKNILVITGISGALAVGLGAFGAHGLEPLLIQNGRLDTFETAVSYHFYHTLGLLGLGILALIKPDWKGLSLAAWGMFLGVLIFSGSLYILCLTGITWLGAITPIGGVGFILGWLGLAYAVLKNA